MARQGPAAVTGASSESSGKVCAWGGLGAGGRALDWLSDASV